MDEKLDSAAAAVQVHRPRSGVVLVQVRGDLDDAALPEFARAVLGTLGSDAPPRLALDLAGVTTLSPQAVDVLLDVEERVRAAGGTLRLLDPSPEVILLLHDAALGTEPATTVHP